ncbi:hypothetical protein TEQG_01402 [Trichophyton equinum CBS 127.97]|uniref:Transmembrane protein n=1 Tax=Trichophyton equinum (strain ATCC MYA-4606 / CBS 127.97) TaxID=559882 RepID=F2PKE5_TRIEC|nr:hypothetical protein TEQG_01402 [Trichophyton equinum CBS 127.97]
MLPLGRRLRLWYAGCVVSTSSHVGSRKIPDNHCVDLVGCSQPHKERILSYLGRSTRKRNPHCKWSPGEVGRRFKTIFKYFSWLLRRKVGDGGKDGERGNRSRWLAERASPLGDTRDGLRRKRLQIGRFFAFSVWLLFCFFVLPWREKKRREEAVEAAEEEEAAAAAEAEAGRDGGYRGRRTEYRETEYKYDKMKKQLQKPSMPAHLSESALWPELFLAGPLIESVQSIKSSQRVRASLHGGRRKAFCDELSQQPTLTQEDAYSGAYDLLWTLHYLLLSPSEETGWRESGSRQYKKINAKREANGRTCAPLTCLKLCLASLHLHLYLTGGFGFEQRGGQRLRRRSVSKLQTVGAEDRQGWFQRRGWATEEAEERDLFDIWPVVVSFGTALCLDPQREQELTREVARKQTARQLREAGVDIAGAPCQRGPWLTLLDPWFWRRRTEQSMITRLSLALLHWIPGASAAPGELLVGFKREIELFRERDAVRNRQLVTLQQELVYSYSNAYIHTHLSSPSCRYRTTRATHKAEPVCDFDLALEVPRCASLLSVAAAAVPATAPSLCLTSRFLRPGMLQPPQKRETCPSPDEDCIAGCAVQCSAVLT